MQTDSDTMPNAVEMEKQLLSAMFMKGGRVVPDVAAIIDVGDLFRTEHRLVFNAIMRLYAHGQPIDYLAVEHELRKTGDFDKIEHSYLLSLIDATFTTAQAVYHANIIKEKANQRRLVEFSRMLAAKISRAENFADVLAFAENRLSDLGRAATLTKRTRFADFFANDFDAEIEQMKAYATRKTGFENLDAEQFFSPGIYVIGATPAAGKTTFCWQLLEQLARRGETCIYCSYEMSRLELFTKSLARELFRRVPATDLTAADIRRGAWSLQLDRIREEFRSVKLPLSVFELQDETVNELLALLKPLCTDKSKAPVVCLDYLQIMPTSRESTKIGIDESIRKIKKFQRDTNTTFIVISSFNRTNYAQSVSFESFKESGNIEYTADVVWALQLNMMNELKGFNNIAETRKRIDEAKKQQPRQIHLKCLKNRQGINYDCFFNYFAAHDCFDSCAGDDFKADNS